MVETQLCLIKYLKIPKVYLMISGDFVLADCRDTSWTAVLKFGLLTAILLW